MNGSSRRAELMSRIIKVILLVSSLQRPSTTELFDVRASIAGRRPITDCAAHSEPPPSSLQLNLSKPHVGFG